MGLVSQAVHDGGRHVLGLVPPSPSLSLSLSTRSLHLWMSSKRSLLHKTSIIFSHYNSYLPLWYIEMGFDRHSFAYLFITVSFSS